MLQRVVRIAQAAARGDGAISVIVATDDERITRHADELGVAWVMTPPSCPTGTDRAQAAVAQLQIQPDFVLNLQGDAPLTPPDFIRRGFLVARRCRARRSLAGLVEADFEEERQKQATCHGADGGDDQQRQ